MASSGIRLPTLVVRSEALTRRGSADDRPRGGSRVRQISNSARSRPYYDPAKKHKFRFEYTPISFEEPDARPAADDRLQRPAIHRRRCRWRPRSSGTPTGSGTSTTCIYQDRGFFGILLEAKYTDVEATLRQNVLGLEEFARARAPIPSIGAIGRVYVVPNISITGEISGFKLPESINEDYKAHYIDFDLYGIVNFTDNFRRAARLPLV